MRPRDRVGPIPDICNDKYRFPVVQATADVFTREQYCSPAGSPSGAQ
jgi:hypothetical protein